MLRVVVRRLGGRVGSRSGGSSSIPPSSAANAAAAHSGAAAALPRRPNSSAPSTVDAVLPRVHCSLLKSVLASSAASPSSSLFTTITILPDVIHVLRLDCVVYDGKPISKGGQPLADILLVNRIHAAVIAAIAARALGRKGGDAAVGESHPPPLLVLVETNLSADDAEVQQFVLRNALRMHPLPATVDVEGEEGGVAPPPVMAVVLSAEVTQRVRLLAGLPEPREAPKPFTPTAGKGAEAVAKKSVPAPQAAPSAAAGASHASPAVPKAPASVPQPPPPAPAPPAVPAAHKPVHKRQASRKQAVAKPKKSLPNRKTRTPRRPPTSSAQSTVSLPPRLLSVDDGTEKLLWSSQPGHPLPLAALAPLINAAVLHKMQLAAASAPPPRASTITTTTAAGDVAAAGLAMHTVVYRAGQHSSAQSVWLGALRAAGALAAALSDGHAQLPVVVEELAAHSHGSLSAARMRGVGSSLSSSQLPQSGKGRGKDNGKKEEATTASATSTAKVAAAAMLEAATAEAPYVYVLIHTSLSPADAAVLQRELDYQYALLRSTTAGTEVAGMSVLTTQDVSSTQLWYVLENGLTHHRERRRSSSSSGADQGAESTTMSPSYTIHNQESASPTSSAVTHTFQEVYRMLANVQPDWSGEHGSSGVQRHPDTLVAEAIRVAAITQTLVQRREAQLREEFASQLQRSAMNADSEAVARAAQKVEMKTMVTEAVEEVSVRHEQATAHLVKTLSSMVGQWSLEKLSDTLESIMRDEVKPIMDVLEERLGSVAQGDTTPSTASTGTAAAAADDDDATVAADEAAWKTDSVALVNGQSAMQETLAGVLLQLQELSRRVEALPTTQASERPPKEEEEEDSTTLSLDAKSSVESDRLLQAVGDMHREYHAELQGTLEALREELRSAAPEHHHPDDTAATTTTTTTAPSAALDAAVSSAMEEVSHTLREAIHKTVTQQLDSYCEVIREHGDGSSSGSGRIDGAQLPLLPVTSFELEEMITRTVNFAVRESTSELEARIQSAMETALRRDAATPASGEDGSGNMAAMKAALEDLWAQVKAEAAEEEAVKLSQHNRQLHRLFRRQQHLQRGGHDDASASPTDGALSLIAVEGAVRSAMLPYMAQMQATLAAATAANRPSSLSSPPNKEE